MNMAKKKTETTKETVETKEEEAKVEAGFYVAEGKSLTSKKGIVATGKKVDATFFPDGQSTLKALVKSGHITEVKG